MKVVISQEPSLFSNWDCEEVLRAHVLAMQPELGAETDKMSLSPQIGDLRSFKPNLTGFSTNVWRLTKRDIFCSFFLTGSFLFEAVNLVCRFHIMADSDTRTQICLRCLCYLQPSPGGRERRHHLNSSSHWHTPSTFLSCRAAAKMN